MCMSVKDETISGIPAGTAAALDGICYFSGISLHAGSKVKQWL